MGNILLLEDDKSLNRGISFKLKKEGYNVCTAFNIKEAKDVFENNKVDLIISDVGLPDGSGFDFCEEIRKISNVHIIMLTALDQEIDIVAGYDIGADDYITKPFSVVVLHKRIEALQRRIQGRQQNNKWIYKDVEVDFLGFCAKKDNNPVDLKPKEIKLLELLIKHKNQVLTRNQMLDSLWEIDEAPADRVIDVYIKNLRKKLDLDCITTVKGIGYKFEDK